MLYSLSQLIHTIAFVSLAWFILKKYKHQSLRALGLVLLISLPMIGAPAATKKYVPPTNQRIAQLLGWTLSPSSPCALCNGYFYQPKFIRDHPNPPPHKKLPTRISAKGPTIFSKTGESILQKDVRISQPGRLTQADKAYIFRNKNSKKISLVKLVGHVHMQEYGKLLVSQKALLHLKDHTAQLDNVVYHITGASGRMGKNNAWGSAKTAHRLANDVITLDQATYSACTPTHPTWSVSASHLTIDQKKGRAVAKNAVIRIKNIPVLYSPYFSFSIDQKRKSGFLFPNIEHSSKDGFVVGLPYYWNMAPNYDMTLTPTYYARRGTQLESDFRYLTNNSHGRLYLSYLPKDKGFERFKQSTLAQFPEPILPLYQPYINRLKGYNDARGYAAFHDRTKLDDDWQINTELNYASDPYYFRDYGATINDVTANQLLNQIDLSYTGDYWSFTILTQAYQTLHQIDQPATINQYIRLPELDASVMFANLWQGINFDMSAQAVNFAYQSDHFTPLTGQIPIGQRYHARPTLSRPINWAAGFLNPSISLDSTVYQVRNPLAGQSKESDRQIPLYAVDSGLYFDQHFNWGQHDYIQTLEPRLFYLYVPYQNQDRYPVYDTQLLPFSYSQLFSLNRFSGFDRIQNANQISWGLSSRILDADDSQQRLKADIGLGYYIDRSKVCLSKDCAELKTDFTPLVADLTFNPNKHWSISSSLAWDLDLKHTNNVQASINYQHNDRTILGAGYTYLHGQPDSADYPPTHYSPSASLYNAHVALPLGHRLSAVGYIYYNLTDQRLQNYFAGLQYDSCCVSVRLIVNRTYKGLQPISSGAINVPQYSTNYIFQIQFKGIGSAGNSNPSALLESSIPGYRDPFKF
jgi:LPS-assembly protein